MKRDEREAHLARVPCREAPTDLEITWGTQCVATEQRALGGWHCWGRERHARTEPSKLKVFKVCQAEPWGGCAWKWFGTRQAPSRNKMRGSAFDWDDLASSCEKTRTRDLSALPRGMHHTVLCIQLSLDSVALCCILCCTLGCAVEAVA